MTVKADTTKHRFAAVARYALATILLGVPFANASEIALTISDARQRATTYNRQFLQSREDIAQANARIATARAGLFPEIALTGNYGRNFIIPSFFVTTTDSAGATQTLEFRTGFKNAFSGTLSVQQPIWEGGRVFAAYAIAREYRAYSEDIARTVQDNIVLSAEQMFYGTILQFARLDALQKAYEAATANADVVEKQYKQGMVSNFELLRAQVEKANLQPQTLQAESDLRLAESRLKSFLGIRLGDTVHIVEPQDDTSLTRLPQFGQLVDSALSRRPDRLAAHHLSNITRKAVTAARADYWPSLFGSYTYNESSASDQFKLGENKSRSSTIGLMLTMPSTILPFSAGGSRTRGEVSYRKADYRKTRLAEDQLLDDVTLEVQQAYDQLIQAKKSLDVQKETIAQAEEGLKIANVRYASGVGTQLEVLSAQAALTQSRQANAQALYFFRVSKAELKKATTIDLDAL